MLETPIRWDTCNKSESIVVCHLHEFLVQYPSYLVIMKSEISRGKLWKTQRTAVLGLINHPRELGRDNIPKGVWGAPRLDCVMMPAVEP